MDVLQTAPWTRVVVADGRAASHPRRHPSERLAVRFAVVSTVAVALLVIAGYVVGSRLAERQVLVDAQHFSQVMGRTLVSPRLTPEFIRGDPAAVAALDDVVDTHLVPNTSIRRVKVWSPDGQVIYSNDPREIGRVFGLSRAATRVLREGDSSAGVTDLDEDENYFERRLGRQLLEVYTRLETTEGDPVIFESYLSVSALKAQRQTVFASLGLLALIGIGVFIAFQVGFGLTNVRWLRRKRAALEAQAKEAAEQERRRVARDLHDGVVQELVGAAYVVDGAAGSLDQRDSEETRRVLRGAATDLRASIQGLRSMMIQIYPASLAERGLTASLQDLVRPLESRGLAVQLDLGVRTDLPLDTAQVIYRCTQEALRNVVHHSGATGVLVRLRVTNESAVLTVRDNGAGLPQGEVQSPDGHLGLQTLRDLAVESRGVLEIGTAPGLGTEVRLELPR